MKIDLDKIREVIKDGRLKEVSQETGIPLRTLEDWRYENNKWLQQTTERLTALQEYINNLEENKMEIDTLEIKGLRLEDEKLYFTGALQPRNFSHRTSPEITVSVDFKDNFYEKIFEAVEKEVERLKDHENYDFFKDILSDKIKGYGMTREKMTEGDYAYILGSAVVQENKPGVLNNTYVLIDGVKWYLIDIFSDAVRLTNSDNETLRVPYKKEW